MESMIEFRDIRVTLPELKVWVHNQLIHFTLAELRLLLLFLADPYEEISSDELVRRLELSSRGCLFMLIDRVRTLLGQRYILTVGRSTYAFAVRKIKVRRSR